MTDHHRPRGVRLLGGVVVLAMAAVAVWAFGTAIRIAQADAATPSAVASPAVASPAVASPAEVDAAEEPADDDDLLALTLDLLEPDDDALLVHTLTLGPAEVAEYRADPSPEGAVLTSYALMTLWRQMWLTGETAAFLGAATSQCQWCAGQAELCVEAGHRAAEGWDVLMKVRHLADGEADTGRVVEFGLNHAPTITTSGDGPTSFHIEDPVTIGLRLGLTWTDDGWTVDGVNAFPWTP